MITSTLEDQTINHYTTRLTLTEKELAAQPELCEWCGREETRGQDLYPQNSRHLGLKWCCSHGCVELYHDCEAAIEADHS